MQAGIKQKGRGTSAFYTEMSALSNAGREVEENIYTFLNQKSC